MREKLEGMFAALVLAMAIGCGGSAADDPAPAEGTDVGGETADEGSGQTADEGGGEPADEGGGMARPSDECGGLGGICSEEPCADGLGTEPIEGTCYRAGVPAPNLNCCAGE